MSLTTRRPGARPTGARPGALLDRLEARPELAGAVADCRARQAAGGPRRFGARALSVDGRMFALLLDDRLVVKLPRARVAALVATGACAPYAPGHGRVMKEWAVVDDDAASIDLAVEAHAYVRGTHARARTRRKAR